MIKPMLWAVLVPIASALILHVTYNYHEPIWKLTTQLYSSVSKRLTPR